MVLPITYKFNRDPDVATPDNLQVPRGLQSKLIFDKTIGTDSLVGNAIQRTVDAFDLSAKKKENANIISAQEANIRFGIKDKLDFKENVSEAEAEAKFNRMVKAQEIERQLAIADQQNTFGDKALNLAIGFAGNAPDVPLFALIPEAGILKATGLLKLARTSKTAAAVLKNPIARAGIAEGLENAAIQPIIAENYKYFGLDYGVEEMFLDVTIGAALGSGFGAVKTGIRGSLLAKERKVRAAHLANMKPLLGIIDDSMRSYGTKDTLSAIQSMVKLQDSVELRRLDGDSIYRSDFVYRSDLDQLPDNLKTEINLRANSESIIPDVSTSKVTGLVTSKINTKTNKISFGDLTESLQAQFPGLSKAKIKTILADELEIESKSNNLQISGDKALAMTNSLERRAKKQALLDTDVENVVPLLKQLQNQIDNQLDDIYNGSVDDFIEAYKTAKTNFESNSKLQKVNIKEFQDLSELEQETILEYLRFFQDANLEKNEVIELDKGNIDMFEEVFERGKFKRKYLDKITKEQAYDNLRQDLNSQNIVPKEALQPSALSKFMEPDFNLKSDIVEAEIETYRYKMTDEEFDSLRKQSESEINEMVDDKAEALDIATQCMIRGAI